MTELEGVVPVLLHNRHIKDIHIQILEKLVEKPCTYPELKKSIHKENGEEYSRSYIRKSLADLQRNSLVVKEYVTHKYTYYLIAEWSNFKTRWDARRKKIKRNLFNKANRKVPSLTEIEREKDGRN